jgi:hypothetical protein
MPIPPVNVLDLEVAAIGDDVDPFHTKDRLGRFGRLRQEAHVDNLVRHLLFDDQLVLRIHRDLDVITDRDMRVPGHRSAVGVCQRYLSLARAIEFREQRLGPITSPANGGDLLGEVLQGVDEANRIIRSDIVVHRFRQKQQLRAIVSLNVRHDRFYRSERDTGIRYFDFPHSLQDIWTRSTA